MSFTLRGAVYAADAIILGMTLPTRIAPPSIIGLINHISHEGFSPNDRVLLENAAEQTAALLDNIVLNERRTANTRLLREVEIASFLQSSLLPSKFPKLRSLRVCGDQFAGGEHERRFL